MLSHSLILANLGSFFGLDGFVVLVIGLLVFGRKLPEVGKNLGKTIVEFKKGLNGSYSDDQAVEEESAARSAAPAFQRGNRISAAPSRSRRLAQPDKESEEV